MCLVGVSLKKGKFSNETNSSRFRIRIQNPRFDTFVTSTSEVRFPRREDFISMPPNQEKCSRDSTATQPLIPRQLHLGNQPELRLSLWVLDMHKNP